MNNYNFNTSNVDIKHKIINFFVRVCLISIHLMLILNKMPKSPERLKSDFNTSNVDIKQHGKEVWLTIKMHFNTSNVDIKLDIYIRNFY